MSPVKVHDVDPSTLVIGANVRLDPRLDKNFLDSIRERGVLQPIVAYRDASQLAVLYGQRRTLAAVQTGRATVPVVIADSLNEADRIINQLAENDHRAVVADGERVAAYRQLELLGMSAAQIAARTSRDLAEVDTALVVAKSRIASGAVRRWETLTLQQAAVLAEFDRDPEAIKELVVAAHKGGFAHRAQQLRDHRAEQEAKQQAVRALTESGITVIERPSPDDRSVIALIHLTDNVGQPVTADAHRECPGHAAFLAWQWIDDVDDQDDEDLESETDAGDGDSSDSPDGGGGSTRWERPQQWTPVYVCRDYLTHGHTPPPWRRDTPTTDAEPSAQQRDAAAAARRDVIQSNKDWISAETVRRDWLRQLLTRKTPPKGATAFIAASLASGDYEISDAIRDGHPLAIDLLASQPSPESRTQAKREATNQLTAHLNRATEARTQMITLGMVLAGYEHKTGKHSWRAVHPPTARYLTFLHACGYELSTVERRACGLHDAQTPAPTDT